jgi:hypothetical protein
MTAVGRNYMSSAIILDEHAHSHRPPAHDIGGRLQRLAAPRRGDADLRETQQLGSRRRGAVRLAHAAVFAGGAS